MRGNPGLGNSRVVDLVLNDPERNALVLVMLQVDPWTGDKTDLLQLQDKVNGYLAYVTSGQMLRNHPGAGSKGVVFQLNHFEELPPHVRALTTQIRRALDEQGITFSTARVSL